MLDSVIDLEVDGSRITLFGDWDNPTSPAPLSYQILSEFYSGKSAEQIRNDFGISECELFDLLRTEMFVSSRAVALYRNSLAKWRELLLIRAESFKEKVVIASDKDTAYKAGYDEGNYVATMGTVQTIVDVLNSIALMSEKKHEAK